MTHIQCVKIGAQEKANRKAAMACQAHKYYQDEALSFKELVKTYFSEQCSTAIEQNLGFPLRMLHKLFSTGNVKADKALDISFGPAVFQLFSLSNKCKEIYVMQLTKDSMEHFKQWLEDEDQALDWSYAANRVCHLEGNRQTWKEKEDQTRRAIKGVYEWENYETIDIDPDLVPEVDLVLSTFCLPGISKTKEEFKRNLKRCTSRLKPGGHLVLIVPLNMSFYGVGTHRFFTLNLSETNLQELLIQEGFVITESEALPNADPCHNLDYSHLYFVLACKEKEACSQNC
ncbi:nicotinamide N-methyltransferase-like [Gastrophryne carolinensis]